MTRQGTGPHLVWIHGLGESSLCFLGVLEWLPGFTHHLVDLPNYGKAHRAQSYSLQQAAELVTAYLSELEAPVLVGHSMGGVVGTFVCEQAPDLVHRFVNVDGNISIGDCGYSLPITQQPPREFCESGHTELVKNLRLLGEEDPAHAGYATSMALAEPKTVYRHSQELVTHSTQEVLAERLAALQVEHLYLAGSPDGAAARSLELLAEAECKFQLIGPSGHWPFIDQARDFAAVVKKWCS